MVQQTEKKIRKKKSNRTRQKNESGDSKVESNDSPEIPDRGKTSGIPGLPSGCLKETRNQKSPASSNSGPFTPAKMSGPGLGSARDH